MPTRKIAAENTGPVTIDASLLGHGGTITVRAEADCERATLTITTTDENGTAADAVRDATLRQSGTGAPRGRPCCRPAPTPGRGGDTTARPAPAHSTPSPSATDKKEQPTVTAALRQTAATIASSLIEGVSVAAALAGGAIGAYIGHELAPAAWSGESRLLAAGAVAVVGAMAVDGITELLLTPLRQLTLNRRRASTSTTVPALAVSLPDGISSIAAAAADDAATQAAQAVRLRLDRSGTRSALTSPERWTGYEDGHASFCVAPGIQLHFAASDDSYGGSSKTFTLLTSEHDAPVTITSLAQLHQHLTARAAGLSTARPADDQALHTV
ncbi:hypothetical protein [Streptomyces sp. NPDC093109]|uniref:hypothetical protein n=1 Tax=Streptomyces sp. NPDC093109 TaxID=3154977 RepID=UPI00344E6F9C